MATQQYSGLNPAQRHLMELFSLDSSEEFAHEIQQVLSRHFRQRAEEESKRLWDAGILDQAALDRLRDEDLHEYLRKAQ